MGSAASNSAVATIVERVTGYLTLVPLPHGHTADAVADAVIARLAQMPPWFTRTLTWDNGREMARRARITAATGVSVYFADPYSPWQRGSNENTNGLLREYLPKGTNLRPAHHRPDPAHRRPAQRPPPQAPRLLPRPARCSLSSLPKKTTNNALRRPPEYAPTLFLS